MVQNLSKYKYKEKTVMFISATNYLSQQKKTEADVMWRVMGLHTLGSWFDYRPGHFHEVTRFTLN